MLAAGPETGRISASVEHQVELSAENLWGEISERLKEALSDGTYSKWFGDVHGLELDDDTLVLVVPSEFTRDWIESNFLGLIGAAVRDILGGERVLELRVRESADSVAEGRAGSDGVVSVVQRAPGRPESGGFNMKYTFDSFVIGSSNRFAHAAALAVAEAPAQAYNPLFIYGSTGLGKTHLLQAIAQYVAEHSGALTVRYVTSEAFVNDFINSLRDKRIEGFKQRYRAYDVLLIDDVQFFEGKERFQEEFFHTFNSLYEAGSQIVLSSDRPPRDIGTLEDRLRSRFEWGLITDIQPPDLETRIAILRKKVKVDGIHVHDEQVLTFIAGRVSTNIRELEGALTRVVAFSSLTGRPMTVELAQDVLRDVFPKGRRPRSRSSGSRISSRSDSVCRSKSSVVRSAPRTSSIHVRSRCTSPANSPTRHCPRSARNSAAATTPRSSTRPPRFPVSSVRTGLCTTSCRNSPHV